MAQLLKHALRQSGLISTIQPCITVTSSLQLPGLLSGLRYTSSSADQAPKERNETATQSPDSTAVEATKSKEEDIWTEVVHEATGQTYWWNQKTGQTSALGQPKPGSKQNTDGSSNAGEEGSKAQWVDPRAEPPMPDNTGKYAAIGAVSGVFLGWASQFF